MLVGVSNPRVISVEHPFHFGHGVGHHRLTWIVPCDRLIDVVAADFLRSVGPGKFPMLLSELFGQPLRRLLIFKWLAKSGWRAIRRVRIPEGYVQKPDISFPVAPDPV